MLRNVCVALGNIGDSRAIPGLVEALCHDIPLVRGHAAWALGAIGGAEAEAALRDALAAETEPEVRDEIADALIPTS
jgi:epoxyqueuosine reductase